MAIGELPLHSLPRATEVCAIRVPAAGIYLVQVVDRPAEKIAVCQQPAERPKRSRKHK